jgi:6-phosphogluconate dehydrogenase
MSEQQHLADVGVTGMATMGRNVARNLASRGFTVAVHNRTTARMREMLDEHGDEGSFVGAESLQELVDALATPRKIIVMVKAGDPTDATVDALVPLLSEGDIVVDAGNAHFADTQRREKTLRQKGIRFVGAGVSGGEEGALRGPSIMPGGDPEAYAELAPMLESIAAQVDGQPCCVHVGPGGAGHFVKMVHNGIEYADMQLIAEAYDVLRHALGESPAQLAQVFTRWNEGELDSFLIEITARVLARTDERTGLPFVDVVLDAAEQKGTGRWTVQSALDLGAPVSVIAEAVTARAVSGGLAQRDAVRAAMPAASSRWQVEDRAAFVDQVGQALLAAKVVAYAQGMDLIKAGSTEHEWGIDLGAMASIWRGGCIIRARLLNRIHDAYRADPDLANLVVAEWFRDTLARCEPAWRAVVADAVRHGVPVPASSGALAYLDSLRAERLPAALVQGQRDLFGAHTYGRVDAEGAFHVQWEGDGAEHRVES